MTTVHRKSVISFIVALLALNLFAISTSARQTSKKRKSPATASSANPADATAKVDLNTASEKDLDGLQGVGPTTAKKIIAGRPYSSIDDLAKSGI